MKTSVAKSLAVLGVIAIMAGLVLLVIGTPRVRAQDEAPTYVGASDCASCHRTISREHSDSNHSLALQDVRKKKTAILADFDQAETLRTVQLPGEDTARPFTKADIAFAVGAGLHVQRYLVEVGRNDYMVLPVEWNVATESWEPYQLADTWPSAAYDWEDNCAYCHTSGFDVERGRWQDPGVQCEDCHGPASNHVDLAKDAGRNPNDEELNAIRGAIFTAPDPQVCGQCHSRGTSPDNHPYPVGYVPGKNLNEFYQPVPTDAGDHWWVTGHAKQPNMQYNEWLNSGHAAALADLQKNFAASDGCLTCHSQDSRQNASQIAAVGSGDRAGQAPEPLKVGEAQWGVTCATCHYPHTDSEQPFELVQEANALCVSCHTNPENANGVHHPVREMFEGMALVPGIDGVPGIHFASKDGPVCLTCHMQQIPVDATTRANHTFKPILPGEADGALPSACSTCHKDLTATDMQLLVADTQKSVQARLSTALTRLGGVPKPAPDSEAMTRYERITEALNFVQNDGSLGIHNYAYADELLKLAESDLSAMSMAEVSPQPTEESTPAATPALTPIQQVSAPETVASGVRPVTVVVIGGVVAFLLLSGVAFFRKPAARETDHD